MKVALLLSGQMRTFRECGPLALDRFWANDPRTELDVYIVTERTPYCKKHLEQVAGTWGKKKDIEEEDLKEVYGAHLKGFLFGDDPEILKEWDSHKAKVQDHFPAIRETTMSRHVKQWFYRYKVSLLAKDSGIPYETVIFARPDMYPERRIPYLVGQEACVIDPTKKIKLWKSSEFCMWGTADVMYKVCELILSYGQFRSDHFDEDSEKQFVSETQNTAYLLSVFEKGTHHGSQIKFHIKVMPKVDMRVAKGEYSSALIRRQVDRCYRK